MMIDFDKGTELINKFHGSEPKTTILYNDEVYMIKYPDPVRQKKNELSYMNNQFSEHIGSSIFRACGFEAQETILGYFTHSNGKRKLVVGCKDFTQDNNKLFEIANLARQILTSEERIYATIESLSQIITENHLIPNECKKEILDGFWNMFVVDCLIGNPDRHLGNWGIMIKGKDVAPAPIYDCGSSLAALVDEDEMSARLAQYGVFKSREFNLTSIYYMDGKKIYYHEIFKNPPEGLSEAIKRIVPKIDMFKIHDIIDSTPELSDIRKEYLKEAMDLRHNQILEPALKRELAKDKQPIKEMVKTKKPKVKQRSRIKKSKNYIEKER